MKEVELKNDMKDVHMSCVCIVFYLQKINAHFCAGSILIQATLFAISVTLAAYCCKVVNCCGPPAKLVSRCSWSQSQCTVTLSYSLMPTHRHLDMCGAKLYLQFWNTLFVCLQLQFFAENVVAQSSNIWSVCRDRASLQKCSDVFKDSCSCCQLTLLTVNC